MTSPSVVDIPFGVGPVLPLFAQNLLFAIGVVIVAFVAWHAHALRSRSAGRPDTAAGIAVAAAWAIAMVAGCTGAWISVFGAWALGGGVGLVLGLGHLSGTTAARITLLPTAAIVLLVGAFSPMATVVDAGLWALVHIVPSVVFGLIGAALAWTAHEGVLLVRRPHAVAPRPTARTSVS